MRVAYVDGEYMEAYFEFRGCEMDEYICGVLPNFSCSERNVCRSAREAW